MSDIKLSAGISSLNILELTGDFSNKAARGEVIPDNPVGSFLDWLFESGTFGCAVLVPTAGILRIKSAPEWPQVIVDVNDARNSRAFLEKRAKSGFELVVGISMASEVVLEVFRGLGYDESSPRQFPNADLRDDLQATWNKESLVQAITVATKLCNQTLCVFAHDGDPIYVLTKLT